MSTHKHIDKICCAALAFVLIVTGLFVNAEKLGVQAAETSVAYESKLFDSSSVHTIDIVIDDWDSFLASCEDEEYAVCSVIIDNESYKNVGIRAKGIRPLARLRHMAITGTALKLNLIIMMTRKRTMVWTKLV